MTVKEEIKKQAELFFLANKTNILEIRGRSMYPALQEGWNAQVSPVKMKELRIGDIIVFTKRGELIIHRVVGKIKVNDKTVLLQKGDNESVPHSIQEAQLIGKLSRVFNADSREIPLKLWRYRDKNELIIFNLLNILYIILYRIKKIIFRDKKNSFVRFFYTSYLRLFFGIMKNNKKYEYS